MLLGSSTNTCYSSYALQVTWSCIDVFSSVARLRIASTPTRDAVLAKSDTAHEVSLYDIPTVLHQLVSIDSPRAYVVTTITGHNLEIGYARER